MNYYRLEEMLKENRCSDELNPCSKYKMITNFSFFKRKGCSLSFIKRIFPEPIITDIIPLINF